MINENEHALENAAAILRSAERVAVLTGAGVSAESGVPTFRASDGLWEGYRIEDVASPYGFERNPRLVWDFYNARRANARSVRPNPGHIALVALEHHWGRQWTLITQNVDGLHRVAGSENLLEIHGSLYRTRCTDCGDVRDRGLDALPDLPQCELCHGLLRPDIVWFHEMLPEDLLRQSQKAAYECDVMMVVGTSAVVYPAAGLIPIAKNSRMPGAKVIELNLNPTDASSLVDIWIYGPSGELLPRLCEKLGLTGPATRTS